MADRNAVTLFESKPQEVEFASGKLTQKVTRILTWQGVEGVPSIRLRISGQDGQVIDEQTLDAVGADDLIVANRIVRILEGLPVLNECSMAEACLAVVHRICKECDRDNSLSSHREAFQRGEEISQILGAQLSDGLFERIQISVPSDLESMIRRLQQAGVEFSTRGIRHEIDQGRVEVTAFLRGLGLEKKEVLEARQCRLRDKATKYAQLFMQYLAAKEHRSGCPCLERTMKHAVACLERGVDDMSTVVAMALFRLAEQKAAAIVAATRISIMPGVSMLITEGDAKASDHPDFDSEKEMNHIAGWVSERMNGDPRAIADDVRKLRAKWETMPIVVE